MSRFYVERQYWARWPRVLLMCKDTGNGVERRRYVPEGGTVEEWKARLRDATKLERRARSDYELAVSTMQGEFARAENLQAEIDGLKWAVEERDTLISDMRAVIAAHEGDWGYSAGKHFDERIEQMGIEVKL